MGTPKCLSWVKVCFSPGFLTCVSIHLKSCFQTLKTTTKSKKVFKIIALQRKTSSGEYGEASGCVRIGNQSPCSVLLTHPSFPHCISGPLRHRLWGLSALFPPGQVSSVSWFHWEGQHITADSGWPLGRGGTLSRAS